MKYKWIHHLVVLKGQEGKVCQLNKTLHELKQPTHAWLDRFSPSMLQYKYGRCQAAHTLFVKRYKGDATNCQ